MTVAAGWLEARVVFAAEQSFEFSASTGSGTVTLPAGAYFMSQLVEEVENAVTSAIASTGFMCRLFNNVSPETLEADGRVRINASGMWDLQWNTPELPAALGFPMIDILDGTMVYGSTNARGLWHPGTLGKYSKHGDRDRGKLVTDFRQTVGPQGTVHALTTSEYRVHDSIRWEGVPARRAKEHHESIPFESFESFFQDVALGRVSYIPVNTIIRLVWDGADPSVYAEGRILWPATHDSEPMIPGWVGRYNIVLPTLVVET